MAEAKIKKVVISGGGTAGWVAASILSSQMGPLLDITLVESDEIGTVGVGEATIPTHRSFHRLIGVDEREFMRATRASFKLGISFENWGHLGEKYFHAFGQIGRPIWMGDFQHLWREANANGFGGSLDDYCLELQAASAGKFETSQNSNLNFAYHLDASLYAQFLRSLSETRGVKRVEGKIENVSQNSENGFIKNLKLDNGSIVEGDFFIDCTGFRSLLMEKTLEVGFDDWSHWLPMNSAWAVQTQSDGPIQPYTRAIAREAGWQWRIPLQHRVGNGIVFCDQYVSEDEARHTLVEHLDGEMIADPRLIKFRTGKRKKAWEKNCLTIGLSSGFMEPLESTSIHLIQIMSTRLVQMFPFNGINDALTNHYNRYLDEELESIRDFIILHYKVTNRDDTEFWRDRQALSIPESLAHRIELYKENGMVFQDGEDLFRVDSWVQVMRGQGLEPSGYHHMGRLTKPENLKGMLEGIRADISRSVQQMPSHEDFLRGYCGTDSY